MNQNMTQSERQMNCDDHIGFESRTPGGLSIFSNKKNIVQSDHISDSAHKLKFT